MEHGQMAELLARRARHLAIVLSGTSGASESVKALCADVSAAFPRLGQLVKSLETLSNSSDIAGRAAAISKLADAMDRIEAHCSPDTEPMRSMRRWADKRGLSSTRTFVTEFVVCEPGKNLFEGAHDLGEILRYLGASEAHTYLLTPKGTSAGHRWGQSKANPSADAANELMAISRCGSFLYRSVRQTMLNAASSGQTGQIELIDIDSDVIASIRQRYFAASRIADRLMSKGVPESALVRVSLCATNLTDAKLISSSARIPLSVSQIANTEDWWMHEVSTLGDIKDNWHELVPRATFGLAVALNIHGHLGQLEQRIADAVNGT